ncbi:MAG: ATP-binding protein [Chloroflexi bacterium]|nr:ATP-binding protein [Chloroflexota bacterium]
MIILPDFRVRQRDFLLKISRAITAQLDLDQLLRMVLEASVSMLGGNVGLIALRDPDDQLRVQAILGVEPEKVDVFEPLLEMAGSDDISVDPDALKLRTRLIARKLNMNLRQVISLPMRISNEMLGIIYVFRSYPGAPTPDETMILQSFADQAAIAVHNAGLYQATIAEKQRLSAILDSSGDGIMILDADQRILRCNQALARMTGWELRYVVGRLKSDVVRWKAPVPTIRLSDMMEAGWPDTLPFEEEGIYLDKEARTFYVDGDIERLDGSTLSIGITYSPLFFEDGSLRNIVCDVRDITHFREAEKMKSTFISIVSHELKTPVALIKGYAGTLRREDARWDESTVRRGLKVIEEEADRLTDLIENILIASKLQVDGVLNVEWQEVKLDDAIERAIEGFATQAGNHKFVVNIAEDFPTVPGDKRQLRSVVDNLISNALKYSPTGGTISITGTYDDNVVEVAISDEGIGLTDYDMQNIFHRFYRSKSADAESVPGTGLGLYLTREIVRAHGGNIWATSPGRNKGTTFIFTIPRYTT